LCGSCKPAGPLLLGCSMSILTNPPPSFTADQIATIAKDHYGLSNRLSPLDSERDQNVKLVEADGSTWILKIANPLEEAIRLDFQCALLTHLKEVDPSLPVPQIRPTLTGAMLAEVVGAGGVRHLVRVVGWLEGDVFAKAAKSPALL